MDIWIMTLMNIWIMTDDSSGAEGNTNGNDCDGGLVVLMMLIMKPKQRKIYQIPPLMVRR